MKSHRKAAASNCQHLLKLRFRLNVAHLRSVADAVLQERWEFWQQYRVDRASIEYTLRNLMSDEQRQDPFNVGWRATSEDLETLASQAYDTWQRRTTEGVL